MAENYLKPQLYLTGKTVAMFTLNKWIKKKKKKDFVCECPLKQTKKPILKLV